MNQFDLISCRTSRKLASGDRLKTSFGGSTTSLESQSSEVGSLVSYAVLTWRILMMTVPKVVDQGTLE